MPRREQHIDHFSMVYNKKPTQLFDNIIKKLRPFGEEFILDNDELFTPDEGDTFSSWLIVEGQFNIHRRDGLIIVTGQAPYILGIAECLCSINHHYVTTFGQCKAVRVRSETVRSLFEKYGLWSDAARILAWQIQFLAARDERLSGIDAYKMVRNKILEYAAIPSEVRDTISLVTFIQQRTHLSSSVIHLFISALKKGGYISIKKGRLVDITTTLPSEF